MNSQGDSRPSDSCYRASQFERVTRVALHAGVRSRFYTLSRTIIHPPATIRISIRRPIAVPSLGRSLKAGGIRRMATCDLHAPQPDLHIELALPMHWGCSKFASPSHQIRISPEKSEFDAKGVRRWCAVRGALCSGESPRRQNCPEGLRVRILETLMAALLI